MPHLLLTALPLLAAAKKSSSSGSSTFFIVILVVIAAVYFLFLRPQQQKARKQREGMSAIAVGDEILTVGGIVGEVIHIDGDRLTLRCAPGTTSDGPDFDPTHFVVMRSAVARKVDPPAGTTVAGEATDDEDAGWDDADQDQDDAGEPPARPAGSGGKARRGGSSGSSRGSNGTASGRNGKGPSRTADDGGSAQRSEEERGG